MPYSREDADAGCDCEGLPEVRDGVEERIKGEEFRAMTRGRLRLAESDFKAGFAEGSTLDVLGGSLGVLEGKGLGLHAEPYEGQNVPLSPRLIQLNWMPRETK